MTLELKELGPLPPVQPSKSALLAHNDFVNRQLLNNSSSQQRLMGAITQGNMMKRDARVSSVDHDPQLRLKYESKMMQMWREDSMKVSSLFTNKNQKKQIQQRRAEAKMLADKFAPGLVDKNFRTLQKQIPMSFAKYSTSDPRGR